MLKFSKYMLISCFLNSVVMASPKLEISESIDLGLLPRIKIIDREVEYKNIGTEELIIDSWSKSCGCMDITMGELRLAPGESSKFLLKIDAGLFIPGSVRVVLYTNDPDKRKSPLEIKYAFHDPLIISPPVLYIEKKADEMALSNIDLQVRDNLDYEIKDISVSEDKIDVKMSIIEKKKSRLDILIPSDFNENLDFQVRVSPNDPNFGVYDIPVKLRIEPKVKFFPKKLIIKKKGHTQKGELLSKFRVLMEEPKEIDKIESNLDTFSFEVEEVNPKEYFVKCFFREGLEFDTIYIENFIKIYFKDDPEAYILPFLYVQ